MAAAPASAPELEAKPLRKSGSHLHRLACAAQNYAWGRHVDDSEVRCAEGEGRACGPGSPAAAPPAGAPRTPPTTAARSCLQVAQLVAASGRSIDPEQPYAELW